MDYITKPIGREKLRLLAELFRTIFKSDVSGRFDVLRALEILPDIFPGCSYQIIDDVLLPDNVPARCSLDENGNFIIEIKNGVYIGAYQKDIGAYRGFICHEICHVFLYKIGYTPIFNRQFGNNVIPPYRSVEWQTKALCGEVMMPYNETKDLSKEEIMDIYGVSKGFAEKRLTY